MLTYADGCWNKEILVRDEWLLEELYELRPAASDPSDVC
jgi:hypothetical protein